MFTDLTQLLSPKNIILFIVVFTRLGGMFVSAPLFSTYPIPQQIKVWLIATITFIIYPFVLAQGSFAMPTSTPELFVILLKEFMVGYVIGYCANLMFAGVEMAASLISMQMGLSASQALDPTSGSTSPVLGHVYTILVTMVFITLNAHQWLFGAVYKSFQSIPPGYGFIFTPSLVQNILFLTGQIFVIALGVALPIFAVLLIADVLLGFVSKMMPQMNIFMVAMPFKIYLGLMLTIMFMQPIAEYVRILLEKFLMGIMALF